MEPLYRTGRTATHRQGLVLLFCGVLLPLSMEAQVPSESFQELPSVECVATLRSARIQQMKGDQVAELARLRTAQETCQGSLEVIAALLDYHRRVGLEGDEHDRLHSTLLRILENDRIDLPTGITTHLLFEPELDEEIVVAALGALERRLESSGEPDPRLLRTLARAQQRLDVFEKAARTWELVHRLDPNESDDWTLVSLYQRLERFNDQAEVLGRLADRVESASFVGTLRVGALTRAGRDEEALAEIDAIAETIDRTSPYQLIPYVEMVLSAAWNLRDAGRDERAEVLFRRALELMPTANVARDAIYHFYADEQERARLDSIQGTAPGVTADPFGLYERGTRFLTSSDYESAYPLLAEAAEAIGDLEAAWFNLAMTAYRLEKWPESAQAYARAAELNPDRVDSWFFSGMALVQVGRCDDAVEPLEKALELDDQRHLAHYHLAACYDELGDAARAVHHRRLFNESRR